MRGCHGKSQGTIAFKKTTEYLRQWTPVDNLREAIFIRNKVTKQHQIKCCNLIFLSKTAANKVKNEVAFNLVNNSMLRSSYFLLQ